MPKKGEIDLRKLKYWRAVMADFEKSGQSGQSYCKDNGIKYTAFANRRRRLTKQDCDRENQGKNTADRHVEFAEVAVKQSTPQSVPPFLTERLEIVFPTGTILRIPNGYSAVTLADIVSVLEG